MGLAFHPLCPHSCLVSSAGLWSPRMQPLFSEMDDFAEEGIKYYLGPLENVVVSLQHADFGKWEVLVKVRRILWEINQDYTPKHTWGKSSSPLFHAFIQPRLPITYLGLCCVSLLLLLLRIFLGMLGALSSQLLELGQVWSAGFTPQKNQCRGDVHTPPGVQGDLPV